jgi:hypothetical protein
MAWNEFSPEEEIQVTKVACQDKPISPPPTSDVAGIIHCEFVPEGTTVNSHYL